jgi:hypothetical protein
VKRLAQVLVLLALSVQSASGAHLLDHHQEWDQKCDSTSNHVCNDISTHDAGSCAICLVCAGGLTFTPSEVPETVGISLAWVSPPDLRLDPIDEIIYSAPRGPPSLPA